MDVLLFLQRCCRHDAKAGSAERCNAMHSNKTGCISDQDLLQLHACLPSSSSSSCSALARMICLRKAFCFSSSPCSPAIAVRASTLLCCSVLSICRCCMLSLQKSSDVSLNTTPLVSPVLLPYVVRTKVIRCQCRCLSKGFICARQASGLTCPNSGQTVSPKVGL